MRDRRGFTLIELTVTSTMMVLLALAGFTVFSAGTRSAAKVKRYTKIIAHGQAAVEAMTRDIRAILAHEDVLLTSLDVDYEGRGADTIDFIAGRSGPTPNSPAGTGRSEVGYYIDNNPDTEAMWLLRRLDDTPDDDPLEGGRVTLVGPFVSELNLEFYNGLTWEPGWEHKEELPQAVRIEIVVVDENEIEKPIRFSTTVAIMAR